MAYFVRNDGQPNKMIWSIPSRADVGRGMSSMADPEILEKNLSQDEFSEKPSINRKVSWWNIEGQRQEKILDWGETFEAMNYPHIQSWDAEQREVVGVRIGGRGREKDYIIKCGKTVVVDNFEHLKQLMETYRFLNQVDSTDREQKIIRKNVEDKPIEILGAMGVLPAHMTREQVEALK